MNTKTVIKHLHKLMSRMDPDRQYTAVYIPFGQKQENIDRYNVSCIVDWIRRLESYGDNHSPYIYNCMLVANAIWAQVKS